FGDDINIEAVDSSKARLGARLSHSLASDVVQLYVGAAAEREFKGQVKGSLAGDPFQEPVSVNGASGFGELGVTIKPTDSKKVSINAEVFGWTGRQQGIGGSAALSYNF
ncbi:MAG: autotransporter outer membrane beta-barrel domain-containing protein, partial [Deltaproteobacteria bacterium]|nr:autotransporter outer membrane beta-barrel domain-containing protein [Deltaproteobacteria bacterium]